MGEFEEVFAKTVHTTYAIAFSNGTSALHGAMYAYDIGPGDEVIVPANTFVASANCVLYQGAKPVFADIEESTLLINPANVESKITSRTRGIIAVDYAGQPCDYQALQTIADKYGLFLHADACHALGAAYQGRSVGSLADSSSFSFHPVKPITTAEGGMVTTDDPALAHRLRLFRGHGISSDFRSREMAGTWEYDMADLGYNCRLSDIQCALGLSQIKHLEEWTIYRQKIANFYHEKLKEFDWIEPLQCQSDRTHAYHLFVTRLRHTAAKKQKEVFNFLRSIGIGAHIMYRPVYTHSFYRNRFSDTATNNCPKAEIAYATILILPIFQGLSDQQMNYIIDGLRQCQKTL